MTKTKIQERAVKALLKMRKNRLKFGEIAVASGISVGHLSGIAEGYKGFTDATAEKILLAEKVLRGKQ